MILEDLIMQLLIFLSDSLSFGGQHQHNRSWFLGLSCHSELQSTPHEDVRNAVVLTKYRDVADHVSWSHISSKDHDPLRSFLYRFHHILHASLQVLLAIEVASQLQNLASESIVCERSSDGRREECLSQLLLHVEI